MSSNQTGGAGSSSGQQCPNECGYDPSNQKHNEQNWQGLNDPRDRPSEDMRFNTHYYNAIDRQIAENYHTGCLGSQASSVLPQVEATLWNLPKYDKEFTVNNSNYSSKKDGIMSSKQTGGAGSSRGQPCQNECGYDPSNRKHNEEHWQGSNDPRGTSRGVSFYPDLKVHYTVKKLVFLYVYDSTGSGHMKFNSHYYNVIDRQIAENHHTRCLGQPGNTQYAKTYPK
ncbi:hypothetical protein Fcan01_08821 [Folsomia candida]|uniref:Uncharacterized protein n=1 Tax=Folsomia candida TaxID=158441 RepID=A0A226EF10_FOLCA|nr:hypothetical protein Fcan01_08821 [Folsomia candida]